MTDFDWPMRWHYRIWTSKLHAQYTTLEKCQLNNMTDFDWPVTIQPNTNARTIHITIAPLCILHVEGPAFSLQF